MASPTRSGHRSAGLNKDCSLHQGHSVLGVPPSKLVHDGEPPQLRGSCDLRVRTPLRTQIPVWCYFFLRTTWKRPEGEIRSATAENRPRFEALAHVLPPFPVQAAAKTCPTLAARRVAPHVLRHTTAMHLLQSDITVNALWLGHESSETTHIYFEDDAPAYLVPNITFRTPSSGAKTRPRRCAANVRLSLHWQSKLCAGDPGGP